MAGYAQFGYPYATAASQLLMPGSQPTATVAGGGGGSGSGCCETGRLVADPVTGQPVCSCQYESSRLAALNSYPRLPAGSSLPYGAAYSGTDQGPYPSIGVDSSYFSSMVSADFPDQNRQLTVEDYRKRSACNHCNVPLAIDPLGSLEDL
ncbi:Homeobox protein araucan [Amphibalanus amphitrite]|uniref:Homeobox protein araucan n=1 Tax=Amphibalanus amphitrite TaxID=1232801 RepID=A0A6A4WZ10_AMPAM|nr:Homeobox protein araucan [Amphibalanus amphitrite]